MTQTLTPIAPTTTEKPASAPALPLFCSWHFDDAGKFTGASWRVDS